VRLVRAPQAAARPAAQVPAVHLGAGRHLAVSLIPVGGASERHPAFFVIKGHDGEPAAVIVSRSSPAPAQAARAGAPAATTTTTAPAQPATTTSTSDKPVTATAFPFKLPAKPGPGDTQALAVNTKDGAVKYVVAYSLVTIRDGAPVTNTNSAYAFASCRACTTVAVSFQVVLVVGTSRTIAPINVAGALNADCPACITAAIADQIVVTLKSEPSDELLGKLRARLSELDALPSGGGNVADEVAAVQHEIDGDLDASGLRANQQSSSTTTGTTPAATTTGSQTPATTTTTSTTTSTTPTTSTSTTPTTSTSTTPTSTTPSQTTTTGTSTTPAPAPSSQPATGTTGPTSP
jgi:putative peptide zinc metalloprotease protein